MPALRPAKIPRATSCADRYSERRDPFPSGPLQRDDLFIHGAIYVIDYLYVLVRCGIDNP